MNRRPLLATTAAAAVLALTAGCAGSDPFAGSSDAPADGAPIVVASANFPENVILGEIYAQTLENAGFVVERKLNIGAREVIYSQVESCALHLVPEYNQALLAFIDPQTTASGTEEVDAALAEALPDGLVSLPSAPAQDNNAIAVTRATADEHGLTSVEQLAGISDDWVFGGPTEWEKRADGFPAFERVYSASFAEYKPLDYSGPITVSALNNGDVDAALLFSTAPEVELHDFVVLDDPHSAFGVNNVVPIVCERAVPEDARAAIETVNGQLTTESLLEMNAAYVNDKRDADDIAAEWLERR